jgi:triosephosphate isomerase (TIM)
LTQLDPIKEALSLLQPSSLCIAYEPTWAIGSGVFPSTDYLTSVFGWLDDYTKKELPKWHIRFLYGGSINEFNAHLLRGIPLIQGMLIGGSSLDFKKFKKIVLLHC